MHRNDTARSRPRALLITKTDPANPRDGGTIRVAALVRELEMAGLDVTVIPIRPDVVLETRDRTGKELVFGLRVLLRALFSCSPSVLRWYSAERANTVARAFTREHPDVVIIEYSQLTPYSPVPLNTVVLDLHNIEHELMRNYSRSASTSFLRMLARIDAFFLRQHERNVARKRPTTLVVSDHDLEVWRTLSSGSDAIVAPNGVSDDAFAVQRAPSTPASFVFIGHLGWQPNVDAARWLVEQVLPELHALIPEAKLTLVGRAPTRTVEDLGRVDGVELHADVVSTLPFLASATAATAPLLSAGGTRLKILEALGSGTPVVSTSLGALGLEKLASAGRLVIADSPAEFAHALASFAREPSDPDDVRGLAERYRWPTALSPAVAAIQDSATTEDHRP